ncbi:MAG: CPBP family glutamic-type intramembrane protease, partial [Rhodocyclaceae bacterium]|nr:CPBP family glutamic-type intramembrane protease [Rhodocyclaceae bacterium]
EGGIRSAMAWSAGLYAVLHFMKPSALPEAMPFDASGALWMLIHVFTDLCQWKHLDSGVALFLAGLLLAWVRERAGHLGWCIGIHAGWVFVIQLSRRLTDGNPDSVWGWLVGSYDGVIGWLAVCWLGGVLIAVLAMDRLLALRKEGGGRSCKEG